MNDYKETHSIKTIVSYKKIYLENNFKNVIIENSCFCCEYAHSQGDETECESRTGVCEKLLQNPLFESMEGRQTQCSRNVCAII